MRKLVHLCFGVLKTRKPYQADYANITWPARRYLRVGHAFVTAPYAVKGAGLSAGLGLKNEET
jgi:hypothetical protein